MLPGHQVYAKHASKRQAIAKRITKAVKVYVHHQLSSSLDYGALYMKLSANLREISSFSQSLNNLFNSHNIG